jgi:hypothetical protein
MSHQRSSPSPEPRELPERRRTSPSKRAVRDALLAELKEDLALRLRPICSQMSEEEFERLVLDMARMRMRFWDLEQNTELQGHYEPGEGAEPDR